MSEQHQNDRGSPVTFDIGHHYACPCCDGTGPTEYALRILPDHLTGAQAGVVPVLRLYEDELESLTHLIAATFLNRTHLSKTCGESHTEIRKKDKCMSFKLTRNEKGRELGEYSLHVVGREADNILPVNTEELQSLLAQVTWIKQEHQASLNNSADRKNRERKIKARMKGKTVDEIKAEVQRVNPFVGEDEPDSQIVTVLLAASFFVGPDIDRLVGFTGYPRNFVADTSCRMQDSGLWADGETFIEHWFDDELQWTELGLAQDCDVADGSQVARRDGEEIWAYQPSGRRLVRFGKE